jgi:hypothetical protein
MNSNQGVDPNLLNQFGYTIGSPLMSTDPTGMDVRNLYGQDPADARKGWGHLSDGDNQGPRNHTVTINKVEGQGGNVFGHVTVSVDGRPAVGFNQVE